ncbi:hypothetical protein NECAME_17051, partial [Necator americanus]
MTWNAFKRRICCKFAANAINIMDSASYRSFFESGSDYTRDFAILELTDDVPKHIHHICLPHMNKNIGIGVKMTKKECKKFYPKKLDDTFCTFERADECTCEV